MPRTDAQEPEIDTAWRIHAVLMDWTGKIDAKAAFALSLELAILTGLAALTAADGSRPLHPGGAAAAIAGYWAGIGLLVASVALSVSAVTPRLGPARTQKEWSSGFIYFGHLRRWEPAWLAQAISTDRVLPVVTRQLVDISRICWRKHCMVRCSFALAALGTLLAAVEVVTR